MQIPLSDSCLYILAYISASLFQDRLSSRRCLICWMENIRWLRLTTEAVWTRRYRQRSYLLQVRLFCVLSPSSNNRVKFPNLHIYLLNEECTWIAWYKRQWQHEQNNTVQDEILYPHSGRHFGVLFNNTKVVRSKIKMQYANIHTCMQHATCNMQHPYLHATWNVNRLCVCRPTSMWHLVVDMLTR